MAYGLLGGAIALELIATTCLKYSQGFTRLWPTLGCIALYIVCFFLLSRALQHLVRRGRGGLRGHFGCGVRPEAGRHRDFLGAAHCGGLRSAQSVWRCALNCRPSSSAEARFSTPPETRFCTSGVMSAARSSSSRSCAGVRSGD